MPLPFNFVTISPTILQVIEQGARVARAGGNTKPYFDRLSDELLQLPEDTLQRMDVASLLESDRLAGQILTRHIRELHACRYDETLNLDQLFFAFPLTLQLPVHLPDNALVTVSVMLSHWLSTHGLIDGHASLAECPLLDGVETQRQLRPSFNSWNPPTTLSGLERASKESTAPRHVAAIWPGALTSTPATLMYFQTKLRTMQSVAPEFTTIKKQVEASMLEVGISLTLFPPASWANGLSLSRIARFRAQLLAQVRAHPLKKEWSFSFVQGELAELTETEPTSWGSFYEETREDMLALFASAARSHNVKLRLR
ncbi:MAG: hypothetical protein Q7U16_01880 [Agitococcus sp.]|nr:hypothetical protein [Agitococcus sp.]